MMFVAAFNLSIDPLVCQLLCGGAICRLWAHLFDPHPCFHWQPLLHRTVNACGTMLHPKKNTLAVALHLRCIGDLDTRNLLIDVVVGSVDQDSRGIYIELKRNAIVLNFTEIVISK